MFLPRYQPPLAENQQWRVLLLPLRRIAAIGPRPTLGPAIIHRNLHSSANNRAHYPN